MGTDHEPRKITQKNGDSRSAASVLFLCGSFSRKDSKIPAAGEGHRRDFVPIDRKNR